MPKRLNLGEGETWQYSLRDEAEEFATDLIRASYEEMEQEVQLAMEMMTDEEIEAGHGSHIMDGFMERLVETVEDIKLYRALLDKTMGEELGSDMGVTVDDFVAAGLNLVTPLVSLSALTHMLAARVAFMTGFNLKEAGFDDNVFRSTMPEPPVDTEGKEVISNSYAIDHASDLVSKVIGMPDKETKH